MAKERGQVNLAKFVRLYNDGKSQENIMKAMGWEPADKADPFKRIRATASFIRTKQNGKVRDEKEGKYISLHQRERANAASNGNGKVKKVAKLKKTKAAKVAKTAKVAKSPKVTVKKAVGKGKPKFIEAIGIARSANGELIELVIPKMGRVVLPFSPFADQMEKLKAQEIVPDAQVEVVATQPEAPAQADVASTGETTEAA